MENTTLIWIMAYVGTLLYFLFKAIKAKKDANAANLKFNLLDFFAKDLLDVIVALVITTIVLVTGNGLGYIEVKLETPSTALFTGIGISSIGVNVLLGLLGFGDNSRKQLRNEVDIATNELETLKQ